MGGIGSKKDFGKLFKFGMGGLSGFIEHYTPLNREEIIVDSEEEGEVEKEEGVEKEEDEVLQPEKTSMADKWFDINRE